ncbi:putative GTP-binding protein 6 [Trichinella nativa]|uniref:GTP-binding protein 6 n=1 Tax=Trichinella nativa TaxID=6335 RepID=A0A0V1L128_9BILA|nr:putative GTP-binding protein 6 [Trichinella nativa]
MYSTRLLNKQFHLLLCFHLQINGFVCDHHLSATLPMAVRIFIRQIQHASISYNRLNSSKSIHKDDDLPAVLPLEDYRDLQRKLDVPLQGVRKALFVLQPKVPKPDLLRLATSNESLEQEALQLVKSVPGWNVAGVYERYVKVNRSRLSILGKGTIEELISYFTNLHHRDGVFLNVARLTPIQHFYLSCAFKMPVYDRYTVALQIFKHYAISKEAKLQAALAELAYMKERLQPYINGEIDLKEAVKLGALQMKMPDKKRRKLLDEQEIAIRGKLDKLKIQRHYLRQNTRRKQCPMIAVIGYTNAGKSTLIHQLTEDRRISSEDRFFATLDVTVHHGQLPCRLDVLYADTVGFFSDLPMGLMPCFDATMEEIACSDLVLHVVDRSHESWLSQRLIVVHNLNKLNVEHVIEVWNKCDKLNEIPNSTASQALLISCLNGEGIDELKMQIEREILSLCSFHHVTLEVPITGDYINQLYNVAAVKQAVPSEDGQKMLISAVLRPYQLESFLKNYDCVKVLPVKDKE